MKHNHNDAVGPSRRDVLRWGATGVGVLALANATGLPGLSFGVVPAQAAGGAATDWMHAAKWGLFNQGQMADWQSPRITDSATWNAAVNRFDVEGVANQAQRLGAGYLIHGIGQNSGFFSAPNPVYDSFVGHAQSRCSTRDLVEELGDALHARGIKLIAYLPANAPEQDPQAVSALGYETVYGPNAYHTRNASFQNKWNQVISYWATKWGTKVDGWWLDGTIYHERYDYPDEPNWNSLVNAARSGNPARIVTANTVLTPQLDYISGDTLWPYNYTNNPAGLSDNIVAPGRWVTAPANSTASSPNPYLQWAAITYLGEDWGTQTPPRYKNSWVNSVANAIADGDGVLTWDAPVANGGQATALTREGMILPSYESQIQEMSDQLLGRFTVNDDDPAVTYGGGQWAHYTGRGVGNWGDDVSATTIVGAWASYTFNGTGIQVIGERDYDMGNVDIYLDNQPPVRVNCFRLGGKRTQEVIWEKKGLSSGSHTVKVVKVDGYYTIIDAFRVLTTSSTVLNNTAAGIIYQGQWGNSQNRLIPDLNQDVAYTLTNGDSFSYTFTGTGIEYISEYDADMGLVDVFIDNVLVQTIDCHRADGKVPRQAVFSKFGLTAGTHTIKGVKKSGKYCLLDGFRVFA